MNYFKIRKIFIREMILKFEKLYSVKISNWTPNPYYKIKYIFINEFSSLLAFIFFKSKINPNSITILNILLALFAMTIFILDLENYIYLSLFIFFSKNVLDNVDGFIARLQKSTSILGNKLDILSGIIYYYAILISLFFHNFAQSEDNEIFIILIIILISDLIHKRKFITKKNEKNKNFEKKIIYKILKTLNFDGRTKTTDFIISIIIIEKLIFTELISTILIYLFLIPKLSRNIYYFLK